MEKIRVALVDDQRLFREGLAALLRSIEAFDFVGDYEHGKAFLDALGRMPEPPHVAVVDMNMPEMNGAELTEALQKLHPRIRVIILSVYDQERFVYKMVEAGAAGYLFKNCDMDELVLAINTTAKSGFYFNEAVLAAIRNGAKYKGAPLRNVNNIAIELTDREHEVLQMICREYTNPEIAEQLHISPRTVDGHRNNLLAKTGSRNTAGLVLFAVSNNLFEVLPR
jgi:DNA-binding NarL/FixJ family response regulator